jgi:hypothetical protein
VLPYPTQFDRRFKFWSSSSRIRPTLDEGPGSNFLGTELDWFEANWNPWVGLVPWSSPFSTVFGSEPIDFSCLGTNLKLLTNKIAWIHWFLDLEPSSKVPLRVPKKGVECVHLTLISPLQMGFTQHEELLKLFSFLCFFPHGPGKIWWKVCGKNGGCFKIWNKIIHIRNISFIPFFEMPPKQQRRKYVG